MATFLAALAGGDGAALNLLRAAYARGLQSFPVPSGVAVGMGA